MGNGGNKKAVAKDGRSLVKVAVDKGNLEMTKFLVEHGVSMSPKERKDLGETLLSKAQSGDVNVVKMLVSAGVDTEATMEDGSTALSLAAGTGQLEIVKGLVEAGAKVDIRCGMYSVSPLYMASVRSHVATAKYLAENGANKDGTDTEGQKEFDKIKKKAG